MAVALVTGASGGIGAEIALLLHKNGYKVAINYNTGRENAEKLADTLGEGALAVKCDVGNSSEVKKMFETIRENLGEVDLLVNNAGIGTQMLFTDISDELWRETFSVNCDGVFYCTKEAVPHMIHEKHGRIINISSMWGETGASCEVHYSASKAAVIGFTKALAKELGPSGITVNCITPALIDTKMNGHLSEEDIAALVDETPVSRIGTPSDIANTVLFLAGESASFITGQVIGVNGGFVI